MAAEDDSDIPDTGAVFTFGKSKFADNLPNKFWVRNDRVLEVACGDEHTALVAESGRVFTFGSNDWGQLGLGTSKTADRPSCIKSLKHEKVNLVSCGRAHTIVATESGKLYSFGANGEGQLGIDDTPSCNVPKCIDSLVTQQYTMLSAGVEHSVALTEDGALFVWGGGSEGQLGLGAQKMECPEPEELLIEDVITCVSCGYYHTAFVTESGDLYTYGESDGGKLGLGEDPEETDTPQKISMPGRVTSVACGGSHTVALTEDGSVYSFGDGQGGQLGHGTTCLQTSTPRKLKVNFKVTTIACGENHTAIISEKGQIYTFGDGRHGKLGSGTDSFSNELVPTKVNRFTKFNVGKISCGGCHMICLAKLRLENGDDVNSEDEAKQEPMMNGMLNHTLRADGSIDLNNSFTARDRRRKHNDSFKNDLNRTLPALAGAPGLLADHLHNTVPAVKSRRLEALPTSKHTDVINDRGDNIYNIKKDVQEDLIKAEVQEEVKSSPRPAPRPVQRRLPDPKRNEDADSGSSEEGVSAEEQEMEETKTLTTPRAPIPPPRPQPKVKGQSESEGEESGESEEKEPEKVEVVKRSKGKEKRPKKKKKQSMGLFGRKKTGISDDEDEGDDDDEADDDEDVHEEVPRKLPVIEVRKDVVKAEEGKTKKGKKKEEEEEDDEEEEVEKKDTKKKGKGKKKKKLKKKKEESEEEEEDEEEKEDKTSKVKDEKKGSEDETESEKKGEKSEKEGEKDKEDEKAPEPPKKKSRTCTIL